MTQHRQPRGVPVGGQFAVTARPEANLTLEQLAEADGCEDPRFDPDDPYAVDLYEGHDPGSGLPDGSEGPGRYAIADGRSDGPATTAASAA